MRLGTLICGAGLATGWLVWPGGSVASAGEPPDLHEVYDLIRTNLAGVSEVDVNQAAVQGLLQRFRAQVSLLTNSPVSETPSSPAEGPLISRAELFDQAYGCVRIARIETGLAAALSEAIARLGSTNALKGLVLDLRYATGQDYAAAAQAADRFISDDRLLLNWGEGRARSTRKDDAFAAPVAVLMNSQTAAAAEALAAVLRQAEVGLLLGTPTAGAAGIFKEFVLKTGQRLRVATAVVEVGEGQALPTTGLTPDILVSVAPEDEKLYFADAYRVVAKSGGAALSPRGTNVAAAATNRPARINEAELVRLRREGINPEAEPQVTPGRSTSAEKPAVVTDPALARAVDLLKGLAVVQQSRRR